MRPVYWSLSALRDIKSQIDFIADDNLDMAQRIAQRIRSVGLALGKLPTGRPGRIAGTYEKSVNGLPYILAYTLRGPDDGQSIHILRVIHTSRDWPAGKWPS